MLQYQVLIQTIFQEVPTTSITRQVKMSILYDSNGNVFTGGIDILQGNTITDPRSVSVNLGALNAETVTQIYACAAATVDIRGTWVGTISFQASVDGTNYIAIPAQNILTEVLNQLSFSRFSGEIVQQSQFQEREILLDAGRISKKIADETAEKQFALFVEKQKKIE